uniref:Uncharacterized protein n=1 Tax=Anguilla anguilla TaxID=7936 RepID=A0A0E9WGM4_ANGAN
MVIGNALPVKYNCKPLNKYTHMAISGNVLFSSSKLLVVTEQCINIIHVHVCCHAQPGTKQCNFLKSQEYPSLYKYTKYT